MMTSYRSSLFFLASIVTMTANLVVGQEPPFPPCFVCGDETLGVTLPDVVVTIPTQEPMACGTIEMGGLNGQIDPQFCPLIAGFIGPCECGPVEAPDAAPVASPVSVEAPTDSPVSMEAPTDSPGGGGGGMDGESVMPSDMPSLMPSYSSSAPSMSMVGTSTPTFGTPTGGLPTTTDAPTSGATDIAGSAAAVAAAVTAVFLL